MASLEEWLATVLSIESKMDVKLEDGVISSYNTEIGLSGPEYYIKLSVDMPED